MSKPHALLLSIWPYSTNRPKLTRWPKRNAISGAHDRDQRVVIAQLHAGPERDAGLEARQLLGRWARLRDHDRLGLLLERDVDHAGLVVADDDLALVRPHAARDDAQRVAAALDLRLVRAGGDALRIEQDLGVRQRHDLDRALVDDRFRRLDDLLVEHGQVDRDRARRRDRDRLREVLVARRARDDLVVAGIERDVGADEDGGVDAVALHREARDQLLRRCEVELGELRLERGRATSREVLAVVAAVVRELDGIVELRPRGRRLADLLLAIRGVEERTELGIGVKLAS
jgi:hypothetical protein